MHPCQWSWLSLEITADFHSASMMFSLSEATRLRLVYIEVGSKAHNLTISALKLCEEGKDLKLGSLNESAFNLLRAISKQYKDIVEQRRGLVNSFRPFVPFLSFSAPSCLVPFSFYTS